VMITLEYETPVCSLVIMWSTPSSRKAQVVARSADGGGIGKAELDVDMVAIDQGGSAMSTCPPGDRQSEALESLNTVLYMMK